MTQLNTPAQLLRQVISHFEAGRLTEAANLCQQVLSRDSGNADAQHLLGVIEHRQGQFATAIARIQKAIELNPKKAEYHNSLGVVYAEHSDESRVHAVHHFWQCLALDPNHVGALQNLAKALHTSGYAEEAVRISRQAVALDPNTTADLNLLTDVGRQLSDSGRLQAAISCLQRAIEVDPRCHLAYRRLGAALDQAGRPEDAIECLERLVSMKPDEPEAYKNLAVILGHLGRFDEAVRYCNMAIEHSPVDAPWQAVAFQLLSEMKRFVSDDPDFQRMEALCNSPALPSHNAVRIRFALGKAYEDVGDFDRAFGHYEAGNRLKRSEMNYAPAAIPTRIDALTSFFTPSRFSEVGTRFAVKSNLPVFVVGMPRSGTTLVERIISSHPQVCGAGELSDVKDMVVAMPSYVTKSNTPFPFALEWLGSGVGRQLAEEYVARLSEIGPSAMRVIDKMPWNFHALGLIAMFWPNAKIVHCRRDPLDTCVSCYTRNFETGHPYACELVALGHYYRHHERLMQHWRKVLPIPMFELQYEELVTDGDRVIRELIDFCDLPWDDGCAAFHDNPRATKTNSREVRRPLNTKSVNRWRRFENHLGPLREALAGNATPE